MIISARHPTTCVLLLLKKTYIPASFDNCSITITCWYWYLDPELYSNSWDYCTWDLLHLYYLAILVFDKYFSMYVAVLTCQSSQGRSPREPQPSDVEELSGDPAGVTRSIYSCFWGGNLRLAIHCVCQRPSSMLSYQDLGIAKK